MTGRALPALPLLLYVHSTTLSEPLLFARLLAFPLTLQWNESMLYPPPVIHSLRRANSNILSWQSCSFRCFASGVPAIWGTRGLQLWPSQRRLPTLLLSPYDILRKTSQSGITSQHSRRQLAQLALGKVLQGADEGRSASNPHQPPRSR